jgi:hypothetical protein
MNPASLLRVLAPTCYNSVPSYFGSDGAKRKPIAGLVGGGWSEEHVSGDYHRGQGS